MPTAKAGYYTQDGAKVPSVTTIISRFKESGGLIHWAWQLGVDGKDYRAERDKAADAGTMAHEAIEIWIKGGQPTFGDDDLSKKAANAFRAYQDWHAGSHVEITHSEVPLVSEALRFGGTLDALGKIGNKPVLLDWKSSNSVYADYLIQIAAYGALVKECMGIDVQGFHLCRFSKDTGDFAHYSFDDLSDGWRAFKLMRELYDVTANLKKRVK